MPGCSKVDVLLFVVDFQIQLIVVTNELVWLEWEIRFLKVRRVTLELLVKLFPLFVQVLSIFVVLFDCIDLLLARVELEGFLKSEGINLL